MVSMESGAWFFKSHLLNTIIRLLEVTSKEGNLLTYEEVLGVAGEDEIDYLVSEGALIPVKGGFVVSRVRLCLAGFKWTSEPEKLAEKLTWQEFEDVCADGLTEHGFKVRKHVILQVDGRWEIDLLGFKRNTVLAVDCKRWLRWRKPKKHALMKAVSLQEKRCKALAKAIRNKTLRVATVEKQDNTVYIYPVLVTAYPPPDMFYDRVPVVPLYMFNEFLLNFEAVCDKLKRITVTLG